MTISRTNLCTNPSAETNVTGWTAQGGTLSRPVVYPAMTHDQGANLFQLTSTGSAYYMTASYTSIAVTGGQWASMRVDVMTEASNIEGARIQFAWATPGGSVYANTARIDSPFYADTVISLVAQAPATATALVAQVQLLSDDNVTIIASGRRFWFDAVVIQTGPTQQSVSNLGYFDGSTSATANKSYAWTGTANASTSTETISLPTTTVQAMVDAPCPRVGVTVDGLGAGNTVYNLWRTSDGARTVVRGARNRSTVDSDYVIDYEAPLGRPVSYDIEVVTGTNYLAATFPDTATVSSSTWWIQDPLVPSSAIPLAVNHQDTAIPTLTAAAVKALAYAADINIIPILGSSQPVALMGTRQVASGVDFSMFTRAATATTTLRNLIQQTPLLLVRTNGVRNDGVPGLAYFASAKPTEMPVTVAYGGTLTQWQLQGDLVAAPSLNVLVPIWTYGTVQALWATYQQAQTTLAAKTYLDVLKSPTGA